jgi:3',5'-cyclic AMP phosphodiesterase CpdA
MKRIAWLTDIHLEFVSIEVALAFISQIATLSPDLVLIGGDTGTARNLDFFLRAFDEKLQCPAFFVMGNHDFYHGSLERIHRLAGEVSASSQWLRWLTTQGIVEITSSTCLLGHGSWADGRLGNGIHSQVELNDYSLIDEFIGLSRPERYQKMGDLGDQAADHFRRLLPQACANYRNILLLTHVPPFREACWHEGSISDDEFLPHFTCKAVGDTLMEIMLQNPHSHLTVLCGHTHGEGEVDILPNLKVKTGGAIYGRPEIQELMIIE